MKNIILSSMTGSKFSSSEDFHHEDSKHSSHDNETASVDFSNNEDIKLVLTH